MRSINASTSLKLAVLAPMPAVGFSGQLLGAGARDRVKTRASVVLARPPPLEAREAGADLFLGVDRYGDHRPLSGCTN